MKFVKLFIIIGVVLLASATAQAQSDTGPISTIVALESPDEKLADIIPFVVNQGSSPNSACALVAPNSTLNTQASTSALGGLWDAASHDLSLQGPLSQIGMDNLRLGVDADFNALVLPVTSEAQLTFSSGIDAHAFADALNVPATGPAQNMCGVEISADHLVLTGAQPFIVWGARTDTMGNVLQVFGPYAARFDTARGTYRFVLGNLPRPNGINAFLLELPTTLLTPIVSDVGGSAQTDVSDFDTQPGAEANGNDANMGGGSSDNDNDHDENNSGNGGAVQEPGGVAQPPPAPPAGEPGSGPTQAEIEAACSELSASLESGAGLEADIPSLNSVEGRVSPAQFFELFCGDGSSSTPPDSVGGMTGGDLDAICEQLVNGSATEAEKLLYTIDCTANGTAGGYADEIAQTCADLGADAVQTEPGVYEFASPVDTVFFQLHCDDGSAGAPANNADTPTQAEIDAACAELEEQGPVELLPGFGPLFFNLQCSNDPTDPNTPTAQDAISGACYGISHQDVTTRTNLDDLFFDLYCGGASAGAPPDNAPAPTQADINAACIALTQQGTETAFEQVFYQEYCPSGTGSPPSDTQIAGQCAELAGQSPAQDTPQEAIFRALDCQTQAGNPPAGSTDGTAQAAVCAQLAAVGLTNVPGLDCSGNAPTNVMGALPDAAASDLGILPASLANPGADESFFDGPIISDLGIVPPNPINPGDADESFFDGPVTSASNAVNDAGDAVNEVADDVSNAVQETEDAAGEVTDDVGNVVSDAEDAADNASDDVDDVVHDTEDAVDNVTDDVSDVVDDAGDAVNQVSDTVNDVVDGVLGGNDDDDGGSTTSPGGKGGGGSR